MDARFDALHHTDGNVRRAQDLKQRADEPDRATVEQAAAWYALLQSDDATETDRADCLHWRRQLSTHELAWQRLDNLWSRFNTVPAGSARVVLDGVLSQAKRKSRKPHIKTAALTLLLFTGGMLGLQQASTGILIADYRTTVGELTTIDLPDMSRLTLNTDSAVDVDYDAERRRIVLRRGEVLVEVASDKQRPFVVETPHGTAEALGTRYTVRYEDNATTIVVLESVVNVCPTDAESFDCRQLQAGEQLRIRQGMLESSSRINSAASAAWAQQRLVVDNRPLAEVLAQLQRYRSGYLYFDDRSLSGLSVSGVFPLDDTNRTLNVLQNTLPIRIRHYTPLLTVVETR